MTMIDTPPSTDADAGMPLRVKLVVVLIILVAVGIILVSNRFLTDRYTADTRNRAELRLALRRDAVPTEPKSEYPI